MYMGKGAGHCNERPVLAFDTSPKLGHKRSESFGLSRLDFRHTVEVESETSYCVCDPDEMICRCRSIESAHIEEVHELDVPELLCQLQTNRDKKYTPQELYGIDRILRTSVIEPDDFYIETCQGYYGEETGAVTLEGGSLTRLEERVDKYLRVAHKPTKAIPALLRQEYGHVLPELQGKSFRVQSVPLSQLDFPAKQHANTLDAGRVQKYQAYFSSVGTGSKNLSQKWLPVGVTQAQANGRYRVIDGYHRLHAAKARNKKKVLVWVAT